MDKRASDFPKAIPKTTEIVPPTTLIQQANVVQKIPSNKLEWHL
jgi:hypothetical protein